MKKTIKRKIVNGHQYQLLALPGTDLFKFEIINRIGSNIERAYTVMTLLQTIKNDQLTARKNRDVVQASILTTLIGEASMVGKNNGNRETTDLEVIAVIKKFINNINESLSVKDNDILRTERNILNTYVPQQMSDLDLKEYITGIISAMRLSSKDAGIVMKELKATQEGLYDGKRAIQITKELLG